MHRVSNVTTRLIGKRDGCSSKKII
ncbi:unnamed protein product, partial [Allacma fusca]